MGREVGITWWVREEMLQVREIKLPGRMGMGTTYVFPHRSLMPMGVANKK